MKTKEGKLQFLIDKMHDINHFLRITDPSDDLYYDTIKSISYLKLTELRNDFVEINNFLIEMGKLNFKKRLPLQDNDTLTNYIATALNFLCEELQVKVVPKHQKILNFLDELIVVTDHHGIISYCNEKFCEIWNLSAEEVKGLCIFSFIADDILGRDFLKDGIHLKDLEITLKLKETIMPVFMNIREAEDVDCSDLIFIARKKQSAI